MGAREIKEQREANSQSPEKERSFQVSQLLNWPLVHPTDSSVCLQSSVPKRLRQTATESLPGDSTLAIIVIINEK